MIEFARWFVRTILKVVAAVLAVTLLAGIWYYSPSSFNGLLDFNLGLIKSGSALLPEAYAAHAEAFLRVMHAETILLYMEALLMVWCILFGLRGTMWQPRKPAALPVNPHHHH